MEWMSVLQLTQLFNFGSILHRPLNQTNARVLQVDLINTIPRVIIRHDYFSNQEHLQ
jgi:hypothetical protein